MIPFNIKALFKESWSFVDGSKWAIWAPLLVFVLIGFIINLLLTLLLSKLGLPMLHGSFTLGYSFSEILTAFVVEIMTIFITAPLITGAQMVALKRVRGQIITPSLGFQYWSMWLNLGTTLIIIALGFGLINVIFGWLISLTLIVSYWLSLLFQILALVAFIVYYAFFIFAILFVADRGESPIDALQHSYWMVKPHGWLVSKVVLCVGIAALIMMLPSFLLSMSGIFWLALAGALLSLLLAIWAIPWFHLVISNVFHKLAD